MISVARVRSRLALQDGEPQNTMLALMIEEATATVGHELGRYLGDLRAVQEIYKGPGCMILLREEPEAEPVPIVEIRGRPLDAWAVVPTTDYVLEGRALRNDTGWPCCPGRVRVTYTRGYKVDAGPSDLQGLIIDLVTETWRTKGKEGMQSETIGDYSYTLADLAARGDSWLRISNRWRRAFV